MRREIFNKDERFLESCVNSEALEMERHHHGPYAATHRTWEALARKSMPSPSPHLRRLAQDVS